MKILLVAYQFCPKGQVGTRRWSKFAKYLALEGYEVHVICAKYPLKDKVNWCHDVENNSNIIVHRLDAKFPAFVHSPNRTFKVKLTDRILKHTTHYLDIAQQWGKVFIPFTTSLIQRENIKNVIVTAFPFTPLIFSATIKEKMPHLNLVFDMRDPWEYFLNNEFKAFDNWRKKVAYRKEKYAFEQADTVLFISDLFKKEYSERHPNFKNKFKVVHNGFDIDDFKKVNTDTIFNFKMVYLGSLMSERIEALVEIAKAIHELNDEFINENFRVDLYSNNYVRPNLENPALQETYDRHFHVQKTVAVSEVPKVLSKYEYCLTINGRHLANAFGVKTFDYMGLNKKIMIIAPNGDLPKVLKASNQYVANYSTDEIKKELLRMKKDSLNKNPNAGENYQQFEIAHLTSKVIQYFRG